jgi:phosphatidylserine decarboxylase
MNPMTRTPTPAPGWLRRLVMNEDLNFLLTNRVPRIALTRLVGWYSRIRSPALTRLSIGVWRLFTDLDLSEARTQRFASLRECFTRELRPGARQVDADPEVFASPCDAIVGACGAVQGTQVFQAKGFPYAMADLFGPGHDTTPFHDGLYVTLRLTSAMYHRFHAPHDLRLQHVRHIAGDTWNVNPIALARVQRLFCRNERAVLSGRLDRGGHELAMVPVAAIAVATLRLHAPDLRLHVRWPGPHEVGCDVRLRKGQEMGWFEQGSTIIVFVPRGFALAPGIEPGVRVRMGQALLRLPAAGSPA